jgi:sarcosine oxidase, subunit alpha
MTAAEAPCSEPGRGVSRRSRRGPRERCEGLAGDTLASALIANGVHLMGRSVKYHRPRAAHRRLGAAERPDAHAAGPGAGGAEYARDDAGDLRGPGAGEPESRSRWPSLGLDVGAASDRLAPLFSAGFYYKTFMWPRGFWDRIYEPAIRRAAGLGRAPGEADAGRYAARAHCDVLVVGAGPAGLATARAAARAGAMVMLVDEQAEPGGWLLSEPDRAIEGVPAWDWLAGAVGELAGMPNVRVMSRTPAIGYYHQNMVGLCQRLTDHLAAPPEGAPRERLWRVRARRVVLAQGALEKPLVFDGKDRPGVMIAGAADTYLGRYGVAVGRREMVATCHDSAWGAAFALARAGVEVPAIVDLRGEVARALLERARALGIEVLAGWTVTGTSGRLRVRSARINPLQGGRMGRRGGSPATRS